MKIIESIIFSIIMIVSSFVMSYMGDVIQILLRKKKQIDFFPRHSFSMIIGIFSTSIMVYLLFSDFYIIHINKKLN